MDNSIRGAVTKTKGSAGEGTENKSSGDYLKMLCSEYEEYQFDMGWKKELDRRSGVEVVCFCQACMCVLHYTAEERVVTGGEADKRKNDHKHVGADHGEERTDIGATMQLRFDLIG